MGGKRREAMGRSCWEVKIGYSFADLSVRVWFYRVLHSDEVEAGRINPNTGMMESGTRWPVNTRLDEIEPSLIMPAHEFEAMVEAARGKFVPSEQMHEHLKDAIMVRDRLLGIVERR